MRSASERPIVVAGMHRSGTSLLAALLQSAGTDIGERLDGPAKGNVFGHFEDLDVLEWHRETLAAQGLPNDGFCVETPVVDAAMGARALALIGSRRQRGGPWGFKDPRVTLFLDFWAKHAKDAGFVFMVREPWAVLESVLRRDSAPGLTLVREPRVVFDIWRHYNELILRFVERHPRRSLVLTADRLVRDPVAAIRRISERFELQLVPADPTVYRPSFLHGTDGVGRWLVEQFCPDVVDTWARLSNTAGELYEPGDMPASSACFEWWRDRINVGQNLIDAFETERAQLIDAHEKLRDQVHSVSDELGSTLQRLKDSEIGTRRRWSMERFYSNEPCDHSDILFVIDNPAPEQITQGRSVSISGWVGGLARRLGRVRVTDEGHQPLVEVAVELSRPDVRLVFPVLPAGSELGFQARLDVDPEASAKSYLIECAADDSDFIPFARLSYEALGRQP